MKLYALLCSTLLLSGCSAYMEANRPAPVDLSKFIPGEAREDILADLGTPTGNVQDSGASCDIYKLYTHGPGAAGKGAIIVGEAAADVFTLGLAEVALTPTEAMTKSGKHTVLMCYGADDKLAFYKESKDVDSAPN